MKKTYKRFVPGISLVVNTKNEEKNIVDCINSAKSIVDEIIVVDMESTDKTVQLAKKMGAKVYSVPNYNHVGPVRNYALNKATKKWIFLLDADERLTKRLTELIKKIVKEDQYDVVEFPRKNIRFGEWMEYTGWWPDYQSRLFKKGFKKWPAKVDQADLPQIVKGKILTLEAKEENAFVHYNQPDIKGYLLMLADRYTLEGSGSYFNKEKVVPQDLINYCQGEFELRYIEEKGYLDGMRGYVSSKFREYTRFIEFTNWWERKDHPELFDQKKLLKIISDDITAKEELQMFKASKTFKIWQFCCKYRDLLKRLIVR